MKKSFTLKAFAFGALAALGLSASALAPDFQAVRLDKDMANTANLQAAKGAANEMNIGISIRPELVKASRENAMKVAAHRAEPSWGEWTDGGQMKVEGYMDNGESTKTYQIRLDNANEGNFQVKVSNFFKYSNTDGCSPVITVEADVDNPGRYIAYCETAYNLGWKVNVNVGNNQTVSWDLWWTDHWTWLNFRVNHGATISQEIIDSWKGVSYYLPEEGKIMIQGIYFQGDESDATYFGAALNWGTWDATQKTFVPPYYYDHFVRVGEQFKNYDYTLGYKEGYFSHEKNATTGKFVMPIELNDCGDLYIGMFKELTTEIATTYMQSITQVISGVEGAELPQDIIKVTQKDGYIELPLTLGNPYVKGTKQILYFLLYNNDKYYYSNYSLQNQTLTKNITVNLTNEDVEYYEAGEAKYKDATMFSILPALFMDDNNASYEDFQKFIEEKYGDKFPDKYSTTQPLQASSKTAGKYRILRPFEQYHNDYLSNFIFEYDPTYDILYFTVDGTKVTVLQSHNGLIIPTSSGKYYALNYGSINQYPQSVLTASANCYGELMGDMTNGKITFPTPMWDGNGQAAANIVAPLGWSDSEYDTELLEAEPSTECNIVWDSEESYIAFGEYAGVKNVATDKVDNANAPVEYYNLQGMRVINPEAGQLLIRRQGTNVEKVIIR